MNTNGKVVFHGIGPGPRGYLGGFFDRFTKPKLRVRELENGKRSEWFNRGCNCKHACLITFFENKKMGDSVTARGWKVIRQEFSNNSNNSFTATRSRRWKRGEEKCILLFSKCIAFQIKIKSSLRALVAVLLNPSSYKGILNKCKKEVAKEKANSFRAKFIYTWLPRVFKIYNIP